MARIPTPEEYEERMKAPPRQPPWGFFEQLEGRAWVGSIPDEPVPDPTLEPLRAYLARGGRLTARLRAWLVEALAEDGESAVAIKIQRRRRGKPPANQYIHNEIAMFVIGRADEGVKQEAAILAAEELYGLSRSTIFNILRDFRERGAAANAIEYDPVFRADSDDEE